mmetsp:Transcript_23438/g.34406  ORF Transcript_23438/g.34406 Transcript_23438/m.34406 type:complete len:80 (-) Transcript_23438:709-948(-)
MDTVMQVELRVCATICTTGLQNSVWCIISVRNSTTENAVCRDQLTTTAAGLARVIQTAQHAFVMIATTGHRLIDAGNGT